MRVVELFTNDWFKKNPRQIERWVDLINSLKVMKFSQKWTLKDFHYNSFVNPKVILVMGFHNLTFTKEL